MNNIQSSNQPTQMTLFNVDGGQSGENPDVNLLQQTVEETNNNLPYALIDAAKTIADTNEHAALVFATAFLALLVLIGASILVKPFLDFIIRLLEVWRRK